jgi:hypothetical protein
MGMTTGAAEAPHIRPRSLMKVSTSCSTSQGNLADALAMFFLEHDKTFTASSQSALSTPITTLL